MLSGPRRLRYDTAGATLSALSDARFGELVEASALLADGIGGRSSRLDIGGVPVFVKRVPLTDLERSSAHYRSTANVFDLPMGCHYGVGSPSFGAWREVAANEVATALVLAGCGAGHPLLYHWRVLDGAAADPALAEEFAEAEEVVEYWHGSDAVRRRIEALAEASAVVAMCFEFVPSSMPQWLDERVDAGGATADAAVEFVHRSLLADIAVMNAAGLFHFDAHLDNFLTDGSQLLLADFGLALSSTFDLSAEERAFLVANVSHDACHTMAKFVDWLVTKLSAPTDWRDRDRMVSDIAQGSPVTVPVHAAAAVIERFAPMATILNDFYRTLHLDDRTAVYPAAQLEAACAAIGFDVLAGLGQLSIPSPGGLSASTTRFPT